MELILLSDKILKGNPRTEYSLRARIDTATDLVSIRSGYPVLYAVHALCEKFRGANTNNSIFDLTNKILYA